MISSNRLLIIYQTSPFNVSIIKLNEKYEISFPNLPPLMFTPFAPWALDKL